MNPIAAWLAWPEPDGSRGRYVNRVVRGMASTLALLLGVANASDQAHAAEAPAAASTDGTGELEAAFVKGYASSLLEQTHELRGFTLAFDATVLDVDFEVAPEVPLDTLARSLLEVRGVERVRILVNHELALEQAISRDVEPGTAAPAAKDATDQADTAGQRYEIFPGNEMFEPLIADPRWPRFSGSYQSYLDDELDGVAAVGFGETFPLVRSPEHAWGAWEIAFQAGVFSVFDLDSASFDLVNSDFLVGLSASHHYGDLTTMLRVFHQSSHLGDEFLLSSSVDRVNLSFEVADLLLSFEPWRWLRLYGGGGLLLHREPNLDRGLLQSGIELTSPVAYVSGYLRPVLAVDVQNREESNWRADLSLRAGVQLEHPALDKRRLQILGEFYDGRSPNGQFLERNIKTVGVGLFLGF